jgi:O-methyltransferase
LARQQRPRSSAGAIRAAEAPCRIHEGELIARSPVSGAWVGLTRALREIWDELEYPTDRPALAQRLAWRYEDAAEVVEAGVRDSLDLLEGCGLIEPAPAPSAADRQRHRYLWLLKRALTNLLYVEQELRLQFLQGEGRGLEGLALSRALRDIRAREPDAYRAFVDGKLSGQEPRRHAHTMIGLFRLNSLERCAERVFADEVPGDFLEAGVGQGGAAIFLRALQTAHGEGHRQVWLADSFEGPPPPTDTADARYGLDLSEPRAPWLAIDIETVREHFRRYDLAGPQVRFLAGWLDQTLPAAPTGPLAILRIDVDLFSSTTTALEALYERVSPGGFVIVDDYGAVACCREAVDAFRVRHGVAEPLQQVDAEGVFWRKAGA